MTCIATCYSHFGAIRFQKLCSSHRWPSRLMPVPRDLSSSCGTCVRYEADGIPNEQEIPNEVERIVAITPSGYHTLYWAESSQEEL